MCTVHPSTRRRVPLGMGLRVLPLLIVPVLLSACARSDRADDDAALPVRTTPATVAPQTLAVAFPGVVRARERSQVAPQVPGVLRERRVALGDRVGRGDLLAVLRAPGLEPAREAARAEVDALVAQLAKARLDAERAQALGARQLVARDTVDQTRTAVASLEASLRRAQAQASGAGAAAGELLLRAPQDGVVVQVSAEPGDFLAAGQPLLALSNPDVLEVELQLPPRLAAGLAEDDPVALATLAGEALDGRIAENPGNAAGASGLVRVTVAVPPGSRLATGEPVEARLQVARRAAVQVPLQALRAVGGVPPVMVLTVDDGRARRVEVMPLALADGMAVVEAELPSGTPVIAEAPSALRAGDRVRVLP